MTLNGFIGITLDGKADAIGTFYRNGEIIAIALSEPDSLVLVPSDALTLILPTGERIIHFPIPTSNN